MAFHLISRAVLSLLLVVTVASGTIGQESTANIRAKTFIDNTQGRPPRANLTKALDIFSAEIESALKQRRLLAADLGAGAGNETIHLVKNGWDVVAIDVEPYAIETIQKRVQALRNSTERQSHGTVHLRHTTMQKMALDRRAFDLINASLSLPFVPQHPP